MDLLKFIPRSKHDYKIEMIKNLRTNRHNKILNVSDEEDIIIYV